MCPSFCSGVTMFDGKLLNGLRVYAGTGFQIVLDRYVIGVDICIIIIYQNAVYVYGLVS